MRQLSCIWYHSPIQAGWKYFGPWIDSWWKRSQDCRKITSIFVEQLSYFLKLFVMQVFINTKTALKHSCRFFPSDLQIEHVWQQQKKFCWKNFWLGVQFSFSGFCFRFVPTSYAIFVYITHMYRYFNIWWNLQPSK